MDVHAVDTRTCRTAGPPAAQQRHVVTHRRETTEDLMQVDLGATSLRVLDVLPVDDENAH
jgi:hypothetical protein